MFWSPEFLTLYNLVCENDCRGCRQIFMKLSDYISLQEFFLSSYYPSLELSVTHCSQLQHLGLVQGLSLQITQRGTHSIGWISQFGSLPRLPRLS